MTQGLRGGDSTGIISRKVRFCERKKEEKRAHQKSECVVCFFCMRVLSQSEVAADQGTVQPKEILCSDILCSDSNLPPVYVPELLKIGQPNKFNKCLRLLYLSKMEFAFNHF